MLTKLGIGFLALGALAHAGEHAAPAYSGVWNGKLGSSGIQVCFSADSSYFYLAHLKKITLRPIDETEWEESVDRVDPNKVEATGTWNIRTISEKSLKGTWSDPDGQHRKILSLVKSAGLDRDGHCDQSFLRPLMLRFNSSSARWGEHEIKYVGNANIKGFNLAEDSPNAAPFNSFVQSELESAVAGAYSCGENGRWSVDIKPVLWVKDMLVVAERQEIFCGGPYAEFSVNHLTWNMSAGRPMDLWQYIKGARYHKERIPAFENYDGSPPKELNSILIGKTKQQWMKSFPASPTAEDVDNRNSCMQVIEDNSTYQIWLAEDGLVFSPSLPHATQACGVDIHIGFTELEPFLTAEGRSFSE